MTEYFPDKPTFWVLFDEVNGHKPVKRYLWWFDSRRQASEFRKHHLSDPDHAPLSKPTKVAICNQIALRKQLHDLLMEFQTFKASVKNDEKQIEHWKSNHAYVAKQYRKHQKRYSILFKLTRQALGIPGTELAKIVDNELQKLDDSGQLETMEFDPRNPI